MTVRITPTTKYHVKTTVNVPQCQIRIPRGIEDQKRFRKQDESPEHDEKRGGSTYDSYFEVCVPD